MQPNEFIPGFVLLAIAFCGWSLIRFVRSCSKMFKIAGRLSGGGILAMSFCLLLIYGCTMSIKYRSAPNFAPDHKHIAQVTELDFGPGPFNTDVQLRSRWQIFPKTVFFSHGCPEDIETNWRDGSNLVIRYAAGYPSDW
jgi:hypothetical protein